MNLEKKITPQQKNALHLWYRQTAEALDDAGIDMRTFIRVPIRPSETNFKYEIAYPVMRAINPEAEKTNDMLTTDVVELYETLNRAFAERGYTCPPFPHDEGEK